MYLIYIIFYCCNYLVYGMTLGFPTIVIPAIQGGKGEVQPHEIILNTEEISWFSKFFFPTFLKSF